MAAPTTTVLRPAPAPRSAWLPVALVFVAGTAIGGIASASVMSQVQAEPIAPSVVEPAAPATELTRLLGNTDAAAQRGDSRLFLEFRADLAELISSAGMAEYQALRGAAFPGE